jgi:hypothetical protein
MRNLCFWFLMVALAGCVTRPLNTDEQVSRVRQFNVRSIDGTVADEMSFERWLEARALNGIVAWEANDCGEQTGDPRTTPEDIPICVEASFSNCAGARSSIALMVGMLESGTSGSPQIFWATTGRTDHRTLAAFAEDNPICRTSSGVRTSGSWAHSSDPSWLQLLPSPRSFAPAKQ